MTREIFAELTNHWVGPDFLEQGGKIVIRNLAEPNLVF